MKESNLKYFYDIKKKRIYIVCKTSLKVHFNFSLKIKTVCIYRTNKNIVFVVLRLCFSSM